MKNQELWNKFQFIYSLLGWQKQDRKSFIDAMHSHICFRCGELLPESEDDTKKCACEPTWIYYISK